MSNEKYLTPINNQTQVALPISLPTLRVSLLTGINNEPVTKKILLQPDGPILKESLAHNISYGTCQQFEITMSQFAEGLVSLKPCNAMMYGISNSINNRIINLNDENNGLGEIGDLSRTNINFPYPEGAAIFFGDRDGDADNPAWDFDSFRSELGKIHPDFSTVPMISRQSTGSLIFDKINNTEIVGAFSYRTYFPVTNGSLIPDLGKLLHDHFWLRGHGHYKLSSSGSYLDRGPLDTCVWQGSHIDYNGGAYCINPLEQRLTAPILTNPDAAFLDIEKVIQDLKLTKAQEAQLQSMKVKAKKALAPEAKKIRDQWLVDRKLELTNNQDIADIQADNILKLALENHKLSGEFEFYLSNGDVVTVEQILSDPQTYSGMYCADPIEPTYHHSNLRQAYIKHIPGQVTYVYSYAHGGTKYTLVKNRQQVILNIGDESQAVDDIGDILLDDGNYYRRNNMLAHVDNKGTLSELDIHNLRYTLGHLIQFKKSKYEENTQTFSYIPTKISSDICNMVLGVKLNLTELVSIITAPIMRPDFSILDKSGYDPATKLLLRLPEGVDSSVPMYPTLSMVYEAINIVWYAFKDFPFETDLDRSNFFAALLTAVNRRNISTAPGFSLDAPLAGSGKTMLAESLCILLSGIKFLETETHEYTTNKEELSKTLLSLLATDSPYIFFDNVEGLFGGPLLARFLTSPKISGRLLGDNEMLSASTNLLFLVTGNNINITGDLFRRILTSRINPKEENPELRKFDINPTDYVFDNRLNIVRALLTIIRGYIHLGSDTVIKGSFGSYTEWEKFVRNPICWLASLPDCPIKLVDPIQSLINNQRNDDQAELIKHVFECWYTIYNNKPILTKDIIKNIFENKSLSINETFFSEALSDAIGPLKNTIKGSDITKWLNKQKDVIKNNLQLIKLPTKSGGFDVWKIELRPSTIKGISLEKLNDVLLPPIIPSYIPLTIDDITEEDIIAENKHYLDLNSDILKRLK